MTKLQRDEYGNLTASPQLNSLAAAIIGAVNASAAWLGIDELTAAAEAVLNFPTTDRDICEVCDALWSEGSIAMVREGNATGDPAALVVGRPGEQDGRHSLPQHCDAFIVRREGNRWRALIMANGGRLTWSTEAELRFGDSAAAAVPSIYSPNEVAAVFDRGSYAVAVIDNGSGDDERDPDLEEPAPAPAHRGGSSNAAPCLATLQAVCRLLPDAFGSDQGGPIHHLINVLLGAESDTRLASFDIDTADALFAMLTEQLPDLACPIDDEPADAVRPPLADIRTPGGLETLMPPLAAAGRQGAAAGRRAAEAYQAAAEAASDASDWQRGEAEQQGRDLAAIRVAVEAIAARLARM